MPLLLRVKVKPLARVSALSQLPDGTWVAKVKAPPAEGRANAELIELVAAHFRRPRSAVRIKGGAASRMKTIAIDLLEPKFRRCP